MATDVSEDLAKVGWSAEVDSERVLGGEDVETFSMDMFEFGEARIVHGKKGAGVGVTDALGGPGGVKMEGMGNLFGGILVSLSKKRTVVD